MTATAAQAPLREGLPPWRRLIALSAAVLVLHFLVLLGMAGTFELALHEPLRTGTMQTRWIAPLSPSTTRTAPPAPPRARPAAKPATVSTTTASDPSETSATEPHDDARVQAAPAAAEASAPDHHTVETVSPAKQPAAQDSAAQAPLPPATEDAEPATGAPLSARPGQLPPSTLLRYRLAGMDRGLHYHASGELRWQRNDSAYALGLSVRAFLIGSRQWRSVGEITASGLAPTRFSDSWRSERAAHFDRAQNRIVFSTNTPVATLLPGAQDQISIYLQLAGAMAGESARWPPGTRLRVQTVGVRSAEEALLTLEQTETLQLEGRSVDTAKWVLTSGGRYDARVEFWVTPALAWLPARIRITQTSGSYIDLSLQGQEPLPDLPASPAPADGAVQKTTPS